MSQQNGDLYKLVWGGRLHITETWSCSVHLASAEALSTAVAAEGFEQPIREWFVRTESRINRYATLDFVKYNEVRRVGTGQPGEGPGTYVQAEPDTFLIDPAIQPLQNSAYTEGPGQITWAITLHTERSRGRASVGRFYPPSMCPISPDGRTIGAYADQMANSAQELMSEINAVARGAFPAGPLAPLVSVFSQVGNLAFDAQRVSCGRTADTQRRRRSSILEERVFAAASI